MFWWGRRQVYELPVQASANYITKQIASLLGECSGDKTIETRHG
jgi:hypothetical protein